MDFIDNKSLNNSFEIDNLFNLIDEKKEYSHISNVTKVIHIFHFLFYKDHVKSYKNSSLSHILEVGFNLHNKEKKKLKKFVRKKLREINVSFYEHFDYDKTIDGIKPIEERDYEIDSIFKDFFEFDSYTHLGGCLEPFYFKKFDGYSDSKKNLVDINLKQLKYTKKYFENIQIYDFDLSLLYGIYNEKSMFSDLLKLYLNSYNISVDELYSLLSSDVIFMLKTFDLLDDHIKYAVIEVLLSNLDYELFVLSFPKKTLSGRRMHVNRKEIWLEKMCDRLDLSYEIKDTDSELFYFIN